MFETCYLFKKAQESLKVNNDYVLLSDLIQDDLKVNDLEIMKLLIACQTFLDCEVSNSKRVYSIHWLDDKVSFPNRFNRRSKCLNFWIELVETPADHESEKRG